MDQNKRRISYDEMAVLPTNGALDPNREIGLSIWETVAMKNLLFACVLSANAAADTRIDSMVTHCQSVMTRGVCRVQLDRSNIPNATMLVAGVGRIKTDSYLKIRNAGDQMCVVVRDVCNANFEGDDCKAARALWRQNETHQLHRSSPPIRSENYSSQRTINWYLEGGKGKAPALLIGCPGLTAPRITLAGSGGVRGMFKIDDSTSVMVRGPTVYKVTSGYVSTSLGTIANDGRPVTIGWNGTNVVIASDGSLYSLTLSGSSSTLLLSGIGSVDVLGDFFVATEIGYEQLRLVGCELGYV